MKNFLYSFEDIKKLLNLDETTLSKILNNNLKKKNLIDIRNINNLIKKNKYYNFTKVNLENNKSQEKEKNFSEKYNVLDMFCGAGGFSKGFQMAGFNIKASIDNNKIFCKSHHLNFPGCFTINENIQNYKPEEMVLKIGKNIDVIIGSPPCQTFSSIGVGKIKSIGNNLKNDIRNYYYKSFIDYVFFFKPKMFILENVPGFKSKYGGEIFNDFFKIFSNKKNQQYKLTYKILNSVNFGVPQYRKRIFIVGSTSDQYFNLQDGNNLFDNNINVGEALSDLPSITDDWRIDSMPYFSNIKLSKFQKFMRSKNAEIVKNNICRVSNLEAKKLFRYLKPNHKYKDLSENTKKKISFFNSFKSNILSQRMRRLPLDDPSWTIIAHIGMDGYEYIHPLENRTLSVREAARLQSFPDDFVFLGNMREQYVQVGNAVSPLVAFSIAKKLKIFLKSSF